MAFFEYRGYQCWYFYSGNRKEKKVVLIPDEGKSGASTADFADILAPRFTEVSDRCVYQIDFLGCGQSEEPRSFVSDKWKDQALQLKELFYHEKMDRASLIAFGEGGYRTAAAFLEEAPEMVEMIVVVGSLVTKDELADFPDGKMKLLPPSMAGSDEKDMRVLAAAVSQLTDEEGVSCPYCGDRMLRGYIEGGYRDGVPSWLVAVRDEALEFPGEGGVYLLRNVRPKGFVQKYIFFNEKDGQRKTAWICKACKKLIADMEEI